MLSLESHLFEEPTFHEKSEHTPSPLKKPMKKLSSRPKKIKVVGKNDLDKSLDEFEIKD